MAVLVFCGELLTQRVFAQDVDFSELFADEDVGVIEDVAVVDETNDADVLSVLEDAEAEVLDASEGDPADTSFFSDMNVEEAPVQDNPRSDTADMWDAGSVPDDRKELEQLLLVRDRQIEELKFALEELTADYSKRMEQMRAESSGSSDEVREVVELRTQLELVQHELNQLKSVSPAREQEVTDTVFKKIKNMEVTLEETEGAVAMLGRERDSLLKDLEEKEKTISRLLEDKSDALGDQVAEFKAELEEKAMALSKAENRIRAEYDSQMQALEAGKASAIAKLKAEQATAMAEMAAKHEASLKDLQAKHQEAMAAQKQEYEANLASTRSSLEEKYTSLKDEYDTYRNETDKKLQNAEKLREEVERLTAALDVSQRENEKERFMLAYNSGALFLAAGRYDRAETEFLKALDIRQNDAALHYNMGILYDEHIDRPEKARFHYTRFLELAPSDRDAPIVQQWLRELP
jgi:tetratricopeptide (TPR) repeat protein